MIRLRPSGVDEILIKRVQDWYEPGPGVFIQSLTASFSPAMLFTGSTTGVWYDPSDTTTLFQDAAGTLPVTAVEQPVGLMLDKSKGLVLGPELVTNGDFSSGTTGWTEIAAGWSISGGVAQGLNVASFSTLGQLSTTVSGRSYRCQLTVSNYSSGQVYIYAGSAGFSSAINANGTYTFILTASGSSGVFIRGNNGFTGTVDNISVRELPGNHAFQSSSANRPTLSARYNLLTKTEDFSDAVWTKTAATLGSLVTAPDGSLTAQTVNFVGPTLSEIKQTPSGTFSSTAFLAYVAVKGTAGETLNYGISSGADQVLTFNGQWQYINYTRTTSTPTLWLGNWSGATARSFAVWHPDIRVANDALNQPAYQRVNTSTDYDTVGFKPYLRFNGTNQWLQTNSIDFTYGDKMFVCAGIRKFSNTLGAICETGTNSYGVARTFGVFSEGLISTSSSEYGTAGSGSSGYAKDYAGQLAPATGVLAAQFDISQALPTDQQTLRVNGSVVVATTSVGTTMGTGNFGNYPLYIGSRAGSSLWFNGRLYQMVVAGKQASADEITNTETFINQKTGAF